MSTEEGNKPVRFTITVTVHEDGNVKSDIKFVGSDSQLKFTLRECIGSLEMVKLMYTKSLLDSVKGETQTTT